MIKEYWRLIINKPATGAWNMAVDEAILEHCSHQIVPPTLRFYAWEPYTLSLGRAQPYRDVNFVELEKRKWDLVRRPTGGRAILHADELTYSICAHENEDIVRGSVLDSYKNISRGLLLGLNLMGIEADSPEKKSDLEKHTPDPVCFFDPSDYEITFKGKKIIGSAQSRKKHGVLQHGAVPLNGDITRIVEVLQFNSDEEKQEAKMNLLGRAATIASLLNYIVDYDQVCQAFIDGFKDTFNVHFLREELSIGEFRRAQELLEKKYSSLEWTQKL